MFYNVLTRGFLCFDEEQMDCLILKAIKKVRHHRWIKSIGWVIARDKKWTRCFRSFELVIESGH